MSGVNYMSKQQQADADVTPDDAVEPDVDPAAAAAVESITDGQATDGPADNMAQLRQLLFGSQMRDYDRRFKELADRLGVEIGRLADEQRARVDALDQFVRAELERLAESQRQAQQAINEGVDALARDLAARLDNLQADLGDESSAREQALNALQARTAELVDALDARVRTLDDQLQQERDRLDGQKTGRDELAAMFGELAQRLGALPTGSRG